jgi:hypothetical protein
MGWDWSAFWAGVTAGVGIFSAVQFFRGRIFDGWVLLVATVLFGVLSWIATG